MKLIFDATIITNEVHFRTLLSCYYLWIPLSRMFVVL